MSQVKHLIGALLLLISDGVIAKQMPFNLTPGVTDISQEVYGLHMTILIICCIIGLVVFAAMFWAIIHHRKDKGAKAAQFHESTKVEILWTAIPFLILIGMAIPATKTLIAMENPDDAELTVQITGSQWKWHYSYFGHEVDYYSLLATRQDQINNQKSKRDNYLLEVDYPLVIPVGRKVRFLITSQDVIHSWWVPAFAVKKDANPGFINEAWTKVNTPGIYRGQCAELCGKDHGFMPIVVIAKPADEFDSWLKTQKVALAQAKAAEEKLLSMNMEKDELMALGEQVYLKTCAACHQANGEGIKGAFPGLKGSPVATGNIVEHINIVLNGKSGTAMQGFAKQLGLKELSAVITYERNAWGHNTGDLVQPSQVDAVVKGKDL